LSTYFTQIKLGILGGGQLGRMLLQKAFDYNIECHVLDPDPDAACKALTHNFTVGDYADYNDVLNFGKDLDVITIEIEHVNIEALKTLQKMGKRVYPQPEVLEIIIDKGLQKQFFYNQNLPTAPFILATDDTPDADIIKTLPAYQKSRKLGYDGNGVYYIKDNSMLANRLKGDSVLEKEAEQATEISVIVARDYLGNVVIYPPVEMVPHPDKNLLHYLIAPARLQPHITRRAIAIAGRCIDTLNMIGILAVEMFLMPDGEIWINEVAPRPHNSGHHTIEANKTSQYDQLIRTLLHLPLGDTDAINKSAMLNLLGDANSEGLVQYIGIEDAMKLSGVYLHLYGKSHTKPLRKMGHVTIVGNDYLKVISITEMLDKSIKITS